MSKNNNSKKDKHNRSSSTYMSLIKPINSSLPEIPEIPRHTRRNNSEQVNEMYTDENLLLSTNSAYSYERETPSDNRETLCDNDDSNKKENRINILNTQESDRDLLSSQRDISDRPLISESKIHLPFDNDNNLIRTKNSMNSAINKINNKNYNINNNTIREQEEEEYDRRKSSKKTLENKNIKNSEPRINKNGTYSYNYDNISHFTHNTYSKDNSDSNNGKILLSKMNLNNNNNNVNNLDIHYRDSKTNKNLALFNCGDEINSNNNDNNTKSIKESYNFNKLNSPSQMKLIMNNNYSNTKNDSNDIAHLKMKQLKVMKKKNKKTSGSDIYNDALNSNQNFFLRNNIEKPKSIDFIIDLKRKLNASEDQWKTENLYSKIQIDEIVCSMWIIISLLSSVIYHAICYDNEEECNNDNNKLYCCLLVNSIVNFLYIICNCLRHINYFKLYVSGGYILQTESFFNTELLYHLSAETVLAVFHPNILLNGNTWTTDEYWNLQTTLYFSNDLLIIIQFIRVYLLINIVIVFSMFYGPRADRVSKMISSELDFMFTFKCLMKYMPYSMLIILISMTTIPLSFMLLVVEGPVDNPSKYNSFKSFDTCLWNIFVIITTVGYGDYFPISTLGRLLTVLISFIGTILVSLIIMTLQNSSQFSEYELKSKDFIDRLNAKLEIKEEASNYFKQTLKFLVIKNKYINEAKNLSKIKRSGTDSSANKESFIESEKKEFHHAERLQTALIARLQQKLSLKNLLKNFHRDYEPYDPMSELKDKVTNLDEKISEISEKNELLCNRLSLLINNVDENRNSYYTNKPYITSPSN